MSHVVKRGPPSSVHSRRNGRFTLASRFTDRFDKPCESDRKTASTGGCVADLILHTFDWVPEAPRGFVRDLRVRWALEEAGLPYSVKSVPFHDRGAEHFAHQPFGQVPWLTDGDLSIFESGAILLHLAERSEALMPADPRARAKVIQWLFAAHNSVEMAS